MKLLFLSLFAAILLIGGAVYSTNGLPDDKNIEPAKNNVSIVDGKQIIEVRAHGGYTPEKSVAKAGIPTILRFTTKGTFDCSSFVRIPSMDVSLRLQSNGSSDIDLGVRKAGSLQGTCAMGMYPFEVIFEE